MIRFLAANPDAGDIMPETGGGRKLRWRAQGRGKRGGVRVIYYYHSESFPLFLISVFAKNEKTSLTKSRTERDEDLVAPFGCGLSKKDGAMKKNPVRKRQPPSAGRRIIASLKEAVEWAEGKDVPVRVTTVEVPMIDVRATRKSLGLEPGGIRR